ncbi:hypothetical protein LNQ03_08395 [Klebsiella pneumoniae subsp. pneumoniae]|nr:hypothetical protein [Klebsiella pneumoniae subsp. pneumoniae]
MLDTEQARGLLHRQDASLVSNRSWPEFIADHQRLRAISSRRATSLAPAGATPERLHAHGGFPTPGRRTSAAPTYRRLRGAVRGTFFRRASKWRFIRDLASGPSETFLYTCPRHGLGRARRGVRRRLARMEQQPAHPVARGERGPESSQ